MAEKEKFDFAATGYKLVAERHAKFCEDSPDHVIHTDITAFEYDPSAQKGFVATRTKIWKDRKTSIDYPPDAIEVASMPIPGPTPYTRNSEVENCATSSLGRALALLGYHPKDQFASEDEIFAKAADESVAVASRDATQAQKNMLKARFQKLNGDDKTAWRKFLKDTVGKYALSQIKMDDVDKLVKVLEEAEAFSGKLDEIEADE
jgi:hypothetical protein